MYIYNIKPQKGKILEILHNVGKNKHISDKTLPCFKRWLPSPVASPVAAFQGSKGRPPLGTASPARRGGGR